MQTATATHPLATARFPALGSTIVLAVTEASRLAAVEAHVRACIEAVDRCFSRFRPDSELNVLQAHAGRPWPVSALFIELLDLALQAARSTGGCFDPTVRDLVEAAGYDRSIEQIERAGPGPARAARPAQQWSRVAIDRERRCVTVPADVRLDFGGIGKGFAVDHALAGLATVDIGVLLSAGGDLACIGPAPADGWCCGLDGGGAVMLRQGALATSGLGRRQWRRDGIALHHLVDPRRGVPARSPWSVVTVAAPSCVAADVAAKVAWMKGGQGPDWIESLDLAARFRGADGVNVLAGRWPASEREADA